MGDKSGCPKCNYPFLDWQQRGDRTMFGECYNCGHIEEGE